MIMRLLRIATTMFVYFCLATVVAQVVLAAYLATNWKLDKNKLVQMLAIAQGIDLFALKEEAEKDKDIPSSEQVSFDQILKTRVEKFHDLELREQALRNSLDQLGFEQRQLTDNTKRYKQTRDAFDAELATMQEKATSAGMEDNRTKLEAIQPKQAKQLLDEMLAANEINDVVTLLEGMPTTKAAKIIKEYTTPDDVEKIAGVLRLIRQGNPLSNLAADTQKNLTQPSSPTP